MDKIKEMMPFVLNHLDDEEVMSMSNEDQEILATAMLETIMFAGGGSVPDMIYKVNMLQRFFHVNIM